MDTIRARLRTGQLCLLLSLHMWWHYTCIEVMNSVFDRQGALPVASHDDWLTGLTQSYCESALAMANLFQLVHANVDSEYIPNDAHIGIWASVCVHALLRLVSQGEVRAHAAWHDIASAVQSIMDLVRRTSQVFRSVAMIVSGASIKAYKHTHYVNICVYSTLNYQNSCEEVHLPLISHFTRICNLPAQ